LTAVVYREYLDSGCLIPKPDKLILADINEPVFSHRVPGTVIYARPGQRIKIHVWNCDEHSHPLHVHEISSTTKHQYNEVGATDVMSSNKKIPMNRRTY